MPTKSSKNPEGETWDTTRPIFEFKPEVLKGHDWRQQGPYLICQSCELKHSLYIGVNKQLKGFDKEGKAIIESL